jgi:EmrB/QacA subfamily drug resistance transporter
VSGARFLDARSPTTRSRNAIFAGTSVALLMMSIDTTIVATALPTLTSDLHTSVDWSAWTISGYQLGAVTALPVAGRLSDGFGRKRMFLLFISMFTLASLACGLATNIYLLVAFRFIQALGGAGLVPSVTGIVSDQFGADRDRPIGLLTSIFPLGALIGPALGGVIVTYFSWRLIFAINIPVGVLLIVLLARLVPADDRGARRSLRIDALGSALMSLGLLSLMLGLGELGRKGSASLEAWILIVIAVALGCAFSVRQKYARYPIIPTVLLRERQFAIVNALNLLYGAAIFGIYALVPLYAQVAFGLRPLEAGALLAMRAIGMTVAAAITSLFIMRRFGYRAPMASGFVVSGMSLLLLAVPHHWLSAFAWLSIACTLSGVGAGIAGPPSNNANIELMPSQVGAIVGLRVMFRQTGGIIAISIAAAAVAGSGSGPRILGVVFLVLGVLTLIATPAIIGVPENRGSLRGVRQPIVPSETA